MSALSFWSRKRRIVKMVMGYFDESANTHADFVCMSGYLADDSNWEALTGDWNQLLKKYEIPYMHLADFIASEGIYAALGWKEESRNALVEHALNDFIMVIRRHTLAGISVGVAARTYRDILTHVEKKDKPEVFCFERVLRLAMGRLDEWQWSEPICMIFDDSEAYSIKAYANLCEIKRHNEAVRKRIAGIAFGNDEVFAPLQAADFLAYATSRMYTLGEDAWLKHPQFKNLLIDQNPAFGKIYDSENWTADEIEKQKDKFVAIGNRQDFKI